MSRLPSSAGLGGSERAQNNCNIGIIGHFRDNIGSMMEFVLEDAALTDLAPEIHRQRLVIEGVPALPIDDGAIVDYLTGLSEVCGMITLIDPVTHRSDKFGWAGWIHWETSGAHFYAWETPRLFFSVDVYTCKAFDPAAAVAYTSRYFDASRCVAKEF